MEWPDIIVKLRAARTANDDLMRDAVNEIEWLRAELKDVRADYVAMMDKWSAQVVKLKEERKQQ